MSRGRDLLLQASDHNAAHNPLRRRLAELRQNNDAERLTDEIQLLIKLEAVGDSASDFDCASQVLANEVSSEENVALASQGTTLAAVNLKLNLSSLGEAEPHETA
jgi:hypothetical protein